MLRISIISCYILLQYADAALAQTDSTKKDVALKEVSISAQKKVIEQTPGKTVVNVQATSVTAAKIAATAHLPSLIYLVQGTTLIRATKSSEPMKQVG